MKLRKKIVTNISFYFWSGWLLNHIDIVTLLELVIERKTKKKIKGRERDRENEEKITDIDIDLLVVTEM